MDIFFHLLENLFPLYILIAMGFIAGRWCNVDSKTLANTCIFICVPIVTFGFVVNLEFKMSYIALPLIAYGLEAIVTVLWLYLGRRVYGDNRANLMSICAAMGNTGYFGLPLVILLFDEQVVAVYMFMMLGYNMFEATAGYYVAARGAFSFKESLIKLAKFPLIYSIVLALIFNALAVELPEQFMTYWSYFNGTYVILGMMIIGAALSGMSGLFIAPRFLALVFSGKFIFWPLLAWGFIVVDRSLLGLFDPDIHKLIMITAIVPSAANITAYAAQMDLRPEKAATTVLLGTIFALFYIPAVMMISGLLSWS